MERTSQTAVTAILLGRALACGVLATVSAQEQDPTLPATGAQLLKTDILAVFAHPDDETTMAATIARYALVDGKSVAHVYCTRGEGGGNMSGTQWGPALGILREQELRDCLQILGVRACHFLDQPDWAYTESAAMTLEKWDHEEAVERLTRLLRTLRPEVVLTMSPFPRPGWHGHHQAAGMLAVEATAAAADPRRYPGQLTREGLSPWRAPKVYYRGNRTEGLPVALATIGTRFLLPGGGSLHETVREALANHRSQGFGTISRGGGLMPPETFVRLRSIAANETEESDLFDGLGDIETAGLPWLSTPAAPGPGPGDPELSFIPRPAITGFLQWAERNGVRHLTGALESDIPATRGGSTVLRLRALNLDPGTVRFSATATGVGVPEPAPVTGSACILDVPIWLPAGQEEDFQVEAAFHDGKSMATATATVHPVPSSASMQAPAGLAVDAETGWSEIPAIAITGAALFQGKVASPADCSATMKIANDARFLFTEIVVTDDTLVTNIAPDDIRGHWRSDSVEICIDPGGSEHTLTCFKLGIFPFDTNGLVRAARDADANQGPVEETAPGTRLFSERLADGTGYRIRAAIPLAEAGISPDGEADTIGFNVIVYDGDKADAAPGENINEARIAWSPRPGVQGRPEDWGRVVLSAIR